MGQAEVSAVSERTKRETDATGGERRKLWWAEASVWTERMVSALENGVRGGKWFSLVDKVIRPSTLDAAWRRVARNKGAAGPGSPNKAAAATPGGWIYVFANGSSSVLRREVPSLVCGCTLGESELEAAQPSRVWRLRSGQVAALPPDEAAGGGCRDAARGCVVDHPAGPHASARMV
jgi:hypothetical protein